MKTSSKILLVVVVTFFVVLTSFYIALNTGPKVRTVWTEEEVVSGLEKAGIEIENIEEIDLETLAKGSFSTTGTNDIDESFTQEEMSALIASANEASGPIKDFKVAFNCDGQGEVSFRLSEGFVEFLEDQYVVSDFSFIKKVRADGHNSTFGDTSDGSITKALIDYIVSYVDNRPVYAMGELYRDSANSVQINISSLKVGQIPMPQTVIDRVELETVRIVNSIISRDNGFHIEEMEVRDGAIYYRGTLPAEVEGVRL